MSNSITPTTLFHVVHVAADRSRTVYTASAESIGLLYTPCHVPTKAARRFNWMGGYVRLIAVD